MPCETPLKRALTMKGQGGKMLTEIQTERYADVLLWGLFKARSTEFKKNDIVLIRYNQPALKLCEIVYEKLLKLGLNPIQRVGLTPYMEKQFYMLSDEEQLVFIPPGEEVLYNHLNGSIYLHAPESITHLSEVNPSKIGKTAVSFKPLRDILNKREDNGDFSWTLCSYPTEEPAKHARLTPEDYAKQIIKACFLNRKNPVEIWEDIFTKAAAIKAWLNSMNIKEYHVESQSMDLYISQGEKRKWIGISGHNIPSFELFLSPDWRGVKGVYYSNLPTYRSGNYVEGVRIEFIDGVAVNVTADTGESFVQSQLKMDDGASKVGEFSLTDKRFSKIDQFMANTLYDENFGGKHGNCHIALGASYSDTYDGDPRALDKELKKKLGFNDSALHWDLVNTESKKVTALLAGGGKELIYENGRFLFD